eukprot:c25969_g1_i1.p1 GENE.c25969_g1_i1~~c25969_g1_i1.p1  ORF type:complete len:486 (+),score=78.26 c25969_g1_i1:53-1459(+)
MSRSRRMSTTSGLGVPAKKRGPMFPEEIEKNFVSLKEAPLKRSNCHRLFLLLSDPEESLMGRFIFSFVVLLIFLSSISFVVESLPDNHQYSSECLQCKPLGVDERQDSDKVSARAALASVCRGCEPRSDQIFFVIELVSIVVFTIEYCLRLVLCPAVPTSHEIALLRSGHRLATISTAQRIRRVFAFVFDPLNLVDFVTIFPYWLSFGGLHAPQITALRSARLVRLFRVLKFGELSAGANVFIRVFQKSIFGIITLFVFTIIALIVLGTFIFLCERGDWDPTTGEFYRPAIYYLDEHTPSPFSSIFRSFWYIVVTFTTVGYGDLVPTTTCGQLVGTLVMYFGIMMIAMPITLISSNFAILYDEAKLELEHARRVEHERGEALVRLVSMNEVVPKRDLFRRWRLITLLEIKEESDVDRIIRRALLDVGFAQGAVQGLRSEITSELKQFQDAMRSELQQLSSQIAALANK